MNRLRLGFACFRHDHIYSLYTLAKTKENIEIRGGWEQDSENIKKRSRKAF